MRSAEVELLPRLRDHPHDDAALGQVEPVIGLHARVAPVASGIVRRRHGPDRSEAGAGAALVRGKLPVEELDQIVLVAHLALGFVLHNRHSSGSSLMIEAPWLEPTQNVTGV